MRAGEGVGAVPGQLPEKTRDGQDWAEWAREWREDPQGKADRLVGQWEAEAKETGGSQVGRRGQEAHFFVRWLVANLVHSRVIFVVAVCSGYCRDKIA